MSENRLFSRLAESLLKETQKLFSEKLDLFFFKPDQKYDNEQLEKDTYAIIKYLSQKINKQYIKIIFIIDELDKMNKYSPETQSAFRSLFMDKCSLNLGVVASASYIEEKTGEGSPWYNFFLVEQILPFSENDAIELITKPAKRQFIYDAEAIKKIVDYSKGNPHLIQKYCERVVVKKMLESKKSNRILNILKSIFIKERKRITIEDIENIQLKIQNK